MATVREIRDLMGDPKKVDEDLQAFRRTAQRLSSQRPGMIERYPKEWVALHSGRVRAHGKTLKGVLRKLDEKGFSREQAIVRFIDKDRRTMIL